MRSRASAVTVVTVLTGLLTGCAAAPSSAPTHRTPTSDPSPAAVSPKPKLSASAPASTPLGAGERMWAAFSQRGLPYDKWWAQLKPLLSDAARAVIVYDDPHNIPAMTLTGRIHLARSAPGQPRYTAKVVVPTSKGEFDLNLERHTLKTPWLLYAITFPSGVQ